jgi:glycosyltransferase involved in cell wall biosynthesis
MWNQLADLDIQQFDAVHVRYPYMSLYALALKQASPRLRLVIDVDDITSVLLARKLAYPTKIFRLREFLWEIKELLKTYAFEVGALRAFDSVWVCSELDRCKISRRVGRSRAVVIPNVVDAEKLKSINRNNLEPALLFIGDFNYAPNKEGAEFFVNQAWPKIRSKVPSAELWLIGANRQSQMLAWNGHQGIAVTGAVDDVSQYLERAMVSIAPIFVGAGTRLKILEALGAGLPVVTTSLGAEGIEARNETNLLIADSAEGFANHCVRLLQDPELRKRFTESGKSLIREKYDVGVMSRAVLKCYDLLDSARQKAG